jgi:hypothetical protein
MKKGKVLKNSPLTPDVHGNYLQKVFAFSTIICVAVSAIFWSAGCQETDRKTQKNEDKIMASSTQGELLFVDFQGQDRTLRYELVANRNVVIDLSSPSKNKKQTQEMSEKLTVITAYQPVNYDPYGISKIKATIEDVKVQRKGGKVYQKEPALNFKGKSFTFDITSTGEVVSYQDFFRLAKEVGATALKESRSDKPPTKNVDMIWDVIALHQGIWDFVDNIENPETGIAKGQIVEAPRLVPLPMPRPIYKLVKYKMTDIETSPDGNKVAVFDSDIEIFRERVIELANPYPSRFRMAGMFGFLRGYQFNNLQGTGSMKYDLDRGLLINENQHYTIDVDANLLMPLGDTEPKIFIDQKMSVKLLENKTDGQQ